MTLKVFIGYDPREAVAYHVLAHSIITRASRPVMVCPIILNQLRQIWHRPRDPMQSTDFTYTRFLTPYLAGGGISIFLDSDMLCLTDICQLEDIALANFYHDVLVVKHDYTPSTAVKFLHQPQLPYPCKNWSSVMVFNGHRQAVRRLTPEYVNRASGMDLHQFKWANSVGELPSEWNHLVGEYKPRSDAKIVHYTLGTPCFPEYQNCEYSFEWFQEFQAMTHYEQTEPGAGTTPAGGSAGAQGRGKKAEVAAQKAIEEKPG